MCRSRNFGHRRQRRGGFPGVVLFKGLDGLRLAVLKHLEVGRWKIVDGVALGIGDHDIDHNQVCIGLDGGGGLGRGGLSGSKRRRAE